MMSSASLGRFKPVLLFIALLLVVPLIGFTITQLHGPRIEHEAYANLQSIARLKSQQIENWLTERQSDSAMLAHDEGFAQLTAELMHQGKPAKAHSRVLEVFKKLRTAYGYNSILLLNADGRVVIAQGEHTDVPDTSQRLIQQAINDQQIHRSNLYPDENGQPHLDWVVPVLGADGRKPVAAVMLRAVPQQFLYPLIQTWPTASASAETLLVRLDGEFVLYLNDLRHRKNAALTLRIPVSRQGLPAATAIRSGKNDITAGIDYRGVAVLSAYQPVAGTDWYIVAKIDRDEVMAPLKDLVLWVNLIALVSIGVISAALLAIWRQQQRMQAMRLTAEKEKSSRELSIAEVSLKENQAMTQSLIDSALDGVISMDQEGKVIRWNAQAERIFGYSQEQAMGREVTELIVPHAHREAHRQGMARFIRTNTPTIIGKRIEVPGLRADGTEFPMELTVSALIQSGRHFFSAYVRDITKRKKNERSLQIAAIAFDSLEGMVVADANSIILKVNDAFTRITGFSADEAVGKSTSILKSGRHDDQFYHEMWAALKQDRFWYGEIWNKRKSGEIYPEMLRITAVTDDHGQVTNYVSAFTDISEQKKSEETINSLSFYDPLTHLPNRRLMLERLQQMLEFSERRGQYGAILSLDLDNFKFLNDTKGHDIGDLMLIEVSKRLHTCTHTEDTISRTGGDEFVLLLDALSSDGIQAAAQAEAVAERLRAAMNLPFELRGGIYHISSSIGICLFFNNELAVEELFKRADSAMHQAKSSGRNAIHFFDPATQAALETRVQLESWMRDALPEQFRLYYQPQVDESGRILGAEALIRWLHPENGLISPAMFIPLAEETGLILPIGDWVLETACKQIKVWECQPELQHLQLAINVSAKQFHQSGFVTKVLDVLDRTGANPDRLKLELTESLLVDDVETIIEKMTELKTRGVSFSLDDFGTGFSSLSYLKRLPLDQLKIDQSFVRNLLTDPNDEAIVRTVIALGQSMGLSVIAEGVETEAQRGFLDAHGCHHFQGYLFSKPVAIEQFESLLKQG